MAVRDGSYRGVPVEQRRADRRARLVEATLEVWGSGAGPRVTMTRVCAQAGLTERYFYESFTGLDAALTAVMDQIAEQISDGALAALARTDDSPTERVRAAIATFVQILTDDPRKGRVALVESAATPALQHHRNALLQHFVDLSAREARTLFPDRALDPVSGRLTATLFIGGLAELVTAWIRGTVEATPGDIIETATRQFVATAHR